MPELTEDEVVTLAVDAARTALRVAIGTRPAAYDQADRFMEVFEPQLRDALRCKALVV